MSSKLPTVSLKKRNAAMFDSPTRVTAAREPELSVVENQPEVEAAVLQTPSEASETGEASLQPGRQLQKRQGDRAKAEISELVNRTTVRFTNEAWEALLKASFERKMQKKPGWTVSDVVRDLVDTWRAKQKR
jgi:hypothetical protein